MATITRRDLFSASAPALADSLREACLLGAVDATNGNPARSRSDLFAMFCSDGRKGHGTFLRNAYMAGRFQVDHMGKP